MDTHRSDSDGAVADYLAGATNVSTNGDAVDPVSISDTFFDNTDYIGAFGAEDCGLGRTTARKAPPADADCTKEGEAGCSAVRPAVLYRSSGSNVPENQ